MAMYVQLLQAAFDEQREAARTSTGEDLLAELVTRRRRLSEHERSGPTARSMLDAIADQVAYDVALVNLCTRLGIACDLESFAVPARERVRLETALAARGLVTTP